VPVLVRDWIVDASVLRKTDESMIAERASCRWRP
jgi:hypothetical protein